MTIEAQAGEGEAPFSRPTSEAPAGTPRPRPLLVPGRRSVALLGLPLLLLLLAPSSPGILLFAGALDLLILALTFLDAELATRTRLEVERTLPSRLSVGVRAAITLRLKSSSARTSRLELHDRAPATFEAPRGRLQATVPPWEVAEVRYFVRPPARGTFAWGEVDTRIRGPLGLAWAERREPLATAVKVYPDVRASRILLAGGLRDLQRVGAHTLRREGEGSEIESLRDYVPGDPFRDIDWKATARRDRPVVRVRQPERSQTLLVCVDTSRGMAMRTGTLTKLDHIVNAALLTAFVALRNDDRVGLLLFSDEVTSFLPPGKGRGHYRQILERLHAATPRRTYVDYEALARGVLLRQPRRALVLVLTELHDEMSARPLMRQVGLLAARHLPVVLTLRDPALEAAARAPGDTVEGPYRMAAAAELLDQRDALRRGLSVAGARPLDHLPEEAALAAVNAYVEIKTRHLL